VRARTGSVPAWPRRTAAPFSPAVAPRAAESSSLKIRLTGDCAARKGLTLPAQKRIRRKADFDAAYARGRRLGNGFFGVTASWNDKGWPRLGLAVSVRTAGGGVERNRIRRIIRESFRLHQYELPAVDLVVSARHPARDASGAELHESLTALWKNVAGKFQAPAS
jgi:ribonuclease P protein component